MQVLKKFTPLLRLTTRSPAFFFADNWKERDEASERVYITEAESNFCHDRRGHAQKTAEEGGGRGRCATAEQL